MTTLARTLKRLPPTAYLQAVDFLLQRRFGTTIAAREAFVALAWRRGLRPRDCVQWLAEVEGLS